MIHPIEAATKAYLWGGNLLSEKYGKKSTEDRIAETWELSCHPDGPSILKDQSLTLEDYLKLHPEAGGTDFPGVDKFPMLVKLIDARQDLSVQVHPDDAYAQKHEGQMGKTEMWYVVEATPEAFIYLGFTEEVTAEDYARLIAEDRLVEKLRKVNVKAGDFYFIPAGTIHAIGAGCLIAEVQESSNVTYRVSDYGRKDQAGNTRELHVDQAKEVTALVPWKEQSFKPHLAKTDYFIVDLLRVNETSTLFADPRSFLHVLTLAGRLELQTMKQHFESAPGRGFFIEASTGRVEIKGDGLLLLTRLPEQEK